MVSKREQGFVNNENGEIVICLPSGRISGSSGIIYDYILVDDPDLGQTGHILIPHDDGQFNRPWGE